MTKMISYQPPPEVPGLPLDAPSVLILNSPISGRFHLTTLKGDLWGSVVFMFRASRTIWSAKKNNSERLCSTWRHPQTVLSPCSVGKTESGISLLFFWMNNIQLIKKRKNTKAGAAQHNPKTLTQQHNSTTTHLTQPNKRPTTRKELSPKYILRNTPRPDKPPIRMGRLEARQRINYRSDPKKNVWANINNISGSSPENPMIPLLPNRIHRSCEHQLDNKAQ